MAEAFQLASHRHCRCSWSVAVARRGLPGDRCPRGAGCAFPESLPRPLFARRLLLALALAQPSRIPELGGAACFLARLLTPFAEDPLGKSGWPELANRKRAACQTAVRLVASSTPLNGGAWIG